MVLCPISLSVITARPPCFTEDIPLLASSVSNPRIDSQVVCSQIESNSNTTGSSIFDLPIAFSQKTHPLIFELRSYCLSITTTKTTISSKSRAPQGAPAQDQLAVEHLGRGAPWRRRPTQRHISSAEEDSADFLLLAFSSPPLLSPKVRFGKGLPKTGNLTEPTQEHYHTFDGFVLIVHDMQLKKKTTN